MKGDSKDANLKYLASSVRVNLKRSPKPMPEAVSVFPTDRDAFGSSVYITFLLELHADLSGDMALRIEKAFGVKMDTLMPMQASYDIAKTRKREKQIHVRRVNQLAHASWDLRLSLPIRISPCPKSPKIGSPRLRPSLDVLGKQTGQVRLASQRPM
jgi:hypothetical protein